VKKRKKQTQRSKTLNKQEETDDVEAPKPPGITCKTAKDCPPNHDCVGGRFYLQVDQG